MDQARWMIVITVLLCMIGVLAVLQRCSRQGPAVQVPAERPPIARSSDPVAVPVAAQQAELPPAPSASYLANDAVFNFAEIPTHCQGTEDVAAVAAAQQNLERFGDSP